MSDSSRICAVAAATLMALSASLAAQEAGLPGGASSLKETYEDWDLSCQATPTLVCAATYQQSQQNGRRLLAVELGKGQEDGIAGNLVLPFGLQLAVGATLQVDDGQAGKPLPFSTCLPAGCFVPLSFDAKAAASLRTGTTLKVTVKSLDQKDVPLSVSLKGLTAALDRLK
ncbi:MAG: invasion associated locus B family protein, partial [Mesorhizobium sp.]